MFNLAHIHEVIAETIPDRDAIVTPNRRLRWCEFHERTNRLAQLLHHAGLGCHRERDGLANWESGQDHLAIYLYNCPEYLEGMVGAFKARVAPFNVNYRYVEDELRYLFQDSRARAVIYHGSFAPTLAKVLPQLPPMALLLQVDDGSGEALLPGALDYEQALAGADATSLDLPRTADDLYILYTGGTTGMPKGVLWRQEDIYFGALGGRMPGGIKVNSIDEIRERAPYGEMARMLPAPPFMHGAAHWTALMTLHAGGTVCLPENVRRLDAHDIWSTIEREGCTTLTIVGDAFARPLVDQLRERTYDLSKLSIVGSGGAMLSPALKKAFLEHLPHAMVADGFGASETGAQGTRITTAGGEVGSSFQMDEHTVVLDESLTRKLARSETDVGWLAREGHVPLGYLGDEAKTRRTYPTVEGVRYAVPGDRARYDESGAVQVFGRDSQCINSGGEKIFAEEVELALKTHPSVYDAVVTGTPNERWGQQVTAVVALRPGAEATADEIRETAAATLARYKLPKDVVFVDTILRAPSGKPDYRWAKDTANRALGLAG